MKRYAFLVLVSIVAAVGSVRSRASNQCLELWASPMFFVVVDDFSSWEPLSQGGVKVGSINIGNLTAQTKITIDGTEHFQSWAKQADGTYKHPDGHTMSITSTTVTIVGGVTAGTYQR